MLEAGRPESPLQLVTSEMRLPKVGQWWKQKERIRYNKARIVYLLERGQKS